MTKSDWKKVMIASGVSIFVGITILVYVIVKKKKPLSKRGLNKIISDDLNRWQNIKETDSKGLEMVKFYWGLLGMNFSTATLSEYSHRSKYPWSAAYISYVMKRWGAGDKFNYSPSHSNYIVDAKEERANPKGNIFKAFRITEKPVNIGDIVAVDRGYGINYDNVYRGASTHTDIVIDIEKTPTGYLAHTVGGNISDTVKVRKVELDNKKKIIDNDYFAVLKNQSL